MVLIVEVLLFCISFNIGGLGYRLLLLLLGVTAADILAKHGKVEVNRKFVVIVLYLLSYAILLIVQNALSMTVLSSRIMFPVMMWYWGRELSRQNNHSEKSFRKEIYLIFSGFYLMGLFALLYSIANNVNDRMNVYNIWGGFEKHNSGIQQTIFFLLPESLLVYFVFYGGKGKWIGFLTVASAIINILFFAGRTGFAIMALVNGTALILYLHYCPSSTRIKVVTIILVIAIILVILFINNTFGIATIWEASNMHDRMNQIDKNGDESDSRQEKWEKGLQALFESPFGSDFKYAHNYWIDMALEAGWITGLLLIIYTVASGFSFIAFAKNAKITRQTRLFMISLYMGTIASFMVEPMAQSLPLLVGNLFFMDAAIDEYNVWSGSIARAQRR